jgi:hypothetical protein
MLRYLSFFFLILTGILMGGASPNGLYEIEILESSHDPKKQTAVASGTSCDAQAYPAIPAPEEFARAADVLRQDPALGPKIASGEITTYLAMPPLVPPSVIPADQANCRVLSVGLRNGDPIAEYYNEIVGVNISQSKVIRFAANAPPGSKATEKVCGFKNALQQPSGAQLPGSSVIRITRGGTEIWRLKVVRPSASSGPLGSGVELQNIYYKNKLVLKTLHAPILNVKYEDNACGPYRDWQFAESGFDADGFDVAPGVRIASAPPKTLADSKSDSGSFRGVAIYATGDQVRIVSELEAGWYRYISEYILKDDGEIQPRWGFTGVENSCVCHAHHHHVYWRFEFAVGGESSQIAEVLDFLPDRNMPKWKPLLTEQKYTRSKVTSRQYRFRNNETGEVVTVSAGKKDGFADSFARADNWILNPSPEEISDGSANVVANTEANLDKFLQTEQALSDKSIVFWYSAHFNHDHAHGAEDNHGDNDEQAVHVVGPTLRIPQW